MEIVAARIDEKLIFGTRASMWDGATRYDRAVVIDAESAADETIKATLRIVCPAEKRLSVITLEKARNNHLTKAYGNERIIIVTKSLDDLYALAEAGIKLGTVNLLACKGTVKIAKGVGIRPQDVEKLKWLASQGNELIVQPLPAVEKQQLLPLLEDIH